MILSTPNNLLRFYLDATVTSQLLFAASWVDYYQGVTLSSIGGSSLNTTPITIVPAPAEGVKRHIHEVSIYNPNIDAVTVTLETYNTSSSTSYIHKKHSISSKQTLQYTENGGWSVAEVDVAQLQAKISAAETNINQLQQDVETIPKYTYINPEQIDATEGTGLQLRYLAPSGYLSGIFPPTPPENRPFLVVETDGSVSAYSNGLGWNELSAHYYNTAQNHWNLSTLNSNYVNTSGDTMTGPLVVASSLSAIYLNVDNGTNASVAIGGSRRDSGFSFVDSGYDISYVRAGSPQLKLTFAGLQFTNEGTLYWTSGSSLTNPIDTRLKRLNAGSLLLTGASGALTINSTFADIPTVLTLSSITTLNDTVGGKISFFAGAPQAYAEIQGVQGVSQAYGSLSFVTRHAGVTSERARISSEGVIFGPGGVTYLGNDARLTDTGNITGGQARLRFNGSGGNVQFNSTGGLQWWNVGGNIPAGSIDTSFLRVAPGVVSATSAIQLASLTSYYYPPASGNFQLTFVPQTNVGAGNVGLHIASDGYALAVRSENSTSLAFRSNKVVLAANASINWTNSNFNPVGTDDFILVRDALRTLALRPGTGPLSFRIYNTWNPNLVDYERVGFNWDSNTFKIQTEASGTGLARDLIIGTSGTPRIFVSSTGEVGIGTVTPFSILQNTTKTNKLHVDGLFRFDMGFSSTFYSTNNAKLFYQTSLLGDGNDAGLWLKSTQATESGKLQFESSSAYAKIVMTDCAFERGTLIFSNNGYDAMYIRKSENRNPSISMGGLAADKTYLGATLLVRNRWDEAQAAIFAKRTSNSTANILEVTNDTLNNKYFVVASGGNVGIGTGTPTAPLQVDETRYYRVNFALSSIQGCYTDFFQVTSAPAARDFLMELDLIEQDFSTHVSKYIILHQYDDGGYTPSAPRRILPTYSTGKRLEASSGWGSGEIALETYTVSGTALPIFRLRRIGPTDQPTNQTVYIAIKTVRAEGITLAVTGTDTSNYNYPLYPHTPLTQNNSRVGINVAEPTASLHVNGNVLVETSVSAKNSFILSPALVNSVTPPADGFGLVLRNQSASPYIAGGLVSFRNIGLIFQDGQAYIGTTGGTYYTDFYQWNCLKTRSDFGIGWSNNTDAKSSPDLTLFRDAANTLAQRNSTNAQTFRIYNTYTDASNNERASLGWNASSFEIETESGGTGLARNLVLGTSGTPRMIFSGTGARIDSSGMFVAGSIYPSNQTTYFITNESNRILFRASNGVYFFSVDSQNSMGMAADGQIGFTNTGGRADYSLDAKFTRASAGVIRVTSSIEALSSVTAPIVSATTYLNLSASIDNIYVNQSGDTMTGDLSGTNIYLTGTLAAATKSFLIDHPTKPNKKLQYACLEGPENSVYVRGKVTSNVIELPEYWTGLVHEDSISVNLTPIGFNQVVIDKIEDNKVYLLSTSNSINAFYIVYGTRKDVPELEVEF